MEFTFIANEKNGSGTYTESFEPWSKDSLQDYWIGFSAKMNCLYGLTGFGTWRYEIIKEVDGDVIPDDVRLWFEELGLEIPDTRL